MYALPNPARRRRRDKASGRGKRKGPVNPGVADAVGESMKIADAKILEVWGLTKGSSAIMVELEEYEYVEWREELN